MPAFAMPMGKEVSLGKNDEQVNFYDYLAHFISELVSHLKNEIGYLVSIGGKPG